MDAGPATMLNSSLSLITVLHETRAYYLSEPESSGLDSQSKGGADAVGPVQPDEMDARPEEGQDGGGKPCSSRGSGFAAPRRAK